MKYTAPSPAKLKTLFPYLYKRYYKCEECGAKHTGLSELIAFFKNDRVRLDKTEAGEWRVRTKNSRFFGYGKSPLHAIRYHMSMPGLYTGYRLIDEAIKELE